MVLVVGGRRVVRDRSSGKLRRERESERRRRTSGRGGSSRRRDELRAFQRELAASGRRLTPQQAAAIEAGRPVSEVRSLGASGGGGGSSGSSMDSAMAGNREALRRLQRDLAASGTKLTESERQAVLEGRDPASIRAQVEKRSPKVQEASVSSQMFRNATPNPIREAGVVTFASERTQSTQQVPVSPKLASKVQRTDFRGVRFSPARVRSGRPDDATTFSEGVRRAGLFIEERARSRSRQPTTLVTSSRKGFVRAPVPASQEPTPNFFDKLQIGFGQALQGGSRRVAGEAAFGFVSGRLIRVGGSGAVRVGRRVAPRTTAVLTGRTARVVGGSALIGGSAGLVAADPVGAGRAIPFTAGLGAGLSGTTGQRGAGSGVSPSQSLIGRPGGSNRGFRTVIDVDDAGRITRVVGDPRAAVSPSLLGDIPSRSVPSARNPRVISNLDQGFTRNPQAVPFRAELGEIIKFPRGDARVDALAARRARRIAAADVRSRGGQSPDRIIENLDIARNTALARVRNEFKGVKIELPKGGMGRRGSLQVLEPPRVKIRTRREPRLRVRERSGVDFGRLFPDVSRAVSVRPGRATGFGLPRVAGVFGESQGFGVDIGVSQGTGLFRSQGFGSGVGSAQASPQSVFTGSPQAFRSFTDLGSVRTSQRALSAASFAGASASALSIGGFGFPGRGQVIDFPSFPGGGGSRRKGFGSVFGRDPAKFTPSITAAAFNIRGSKKKSAKFFTGFEFRGL